MKEWPEFNESGDLPIGIHRATLAEVIDHFGRGSFQRAMVAQRLEHIYSLASQTEKVARFIIFGSFVTICLLRIMKVQGMIFSPGPFSLIPVPY